MIRWLIDLLLPEPFPYRQGAHRPQVDAMAKPRTLPLGHEFLPSTEPAELGCTEWVPPGSGYQHWCGQLQANHEPEP